MPRNLIKKKTEPGVVAYPVTLEDLRQRTGIISPPMNDLLDRYGFGGQIGVDSSGNSAVDSEVAAAFLTAYEVAAESRAAKRAAYEHFLAEREARKRRERQGKFEAERSAAAARAKKQSEALKTEREKERERLERQQAKKDKGDFVTFEEWERSVG